MTKVTGEPVTLVNNIPLGILRVTATKVRAFTDTTSRIALTVGTRVVTVNATEDCWIRQGTVTVEAAANTAENILLLRGQMLTLELEAATTDIAAIRLTTNGVLNILEHAQVRS